MAVSLSLASMFAPTHAADAISSLPAVNARKAVGDRMDVVLPVLDSRAVMENGKLVGRAFRIGGLWNGVLTEWGVFVPNEWEEVELTPAAPPAGSPLAPARPTRVWASHVSIESVGTASDRLVQALGGAYELPPVNKAKKLAVFEAVSLASDPRPIGSKPLRLTLSVLNDAGDPIGGEVYLYLDLQSKTGELKEKDPQYRGALLQALTAR